MCPNRVTQQRRLNRTEKNSDLHTVTLSCTKNINAFTLKKEKSFSLCFKKERERKKKSNWSISCEQHFAVNTSPVSADYTTPVNVVSSTDTFPKDEHALPQLLFGACCAEGVLLFSVSLSVSESASLETSRPDLTFGWKCWQAPSQGLPSFNN